jgi:hypothetical protein
MSKGPIFLAITLMCIIQVYSTSISVIDPIGFRPLSGRLEGKAVLADPIGACTMINDVHNSQEDIFILADDS